MAECVTNDTVITYLKDTSKKDTLTWLKEVHMCAEKPSVRSYEHCLDKVIKKETNIKKNKGKPIFNDQYANFMKEEFQFPKVLKTPRKRQISNQNCLHIMQDALEETSHKLAEELNKSKADLQSTKNVVSVLKHEKSKLRKLFKNSRRVINRITGHLAIVKSKNRRLLQENSRLSLTAQERLKKLKRCMEREKYYRNKVKKIDNNDTSRSEDDINLNESLNSMKGTISKLKTDLQSEKQNKDYLESLLQTDNSSVTLYDQDERCFSSRCQLCVYDLLQCNVATSKVSKVIETVLAMADLKPDRLPSCSTVKNMNIARLICAQKQVNEILSCQPNTCLMSDETSKFGKKIQGFHLSDEEGTQWVLGVRDLQSKSSVHVLDAFKEVLKDIDDSAEAASNEASKHLLFNISTTMSDKAATEAKFHDLLQEYRSEILPEVVENYSRLTEKEQQSISTVHNFFCGLHSLVHIATGANTAAIQAESAFFLDPKPILDKSFQKNSESGAARLVRTASKALSRGGDEGSGCHGAFMDMVGPFLKGSKLTTLPLQPYRGHRFNILFSNAAALFFLHEEVLTFLKDFHGNRLLQAVLHDLQVPQYLAGVKAFGLISKFITEPLWSLIEKRNVHILDMNKKYQELVLFLKDAAINPQECIAGNLLVFGDETSLKKDAIYESLVKDWQHDDLVESILIIMLSTIAKVAEHQFQDHLPGGKIQGLEDDENIRDKSVAVPRHNKFAETIFGFFDQLTRTKPAISTIAAEAYTAYSFNKTSGWLREKNDKELKVLVSSARHSVAFVRSKFQERQREIALERRRRTEEKLEKERTARQRKIERLEKFTSDMISYGLWQTQEQVDEHLRRLDNASSKREAVRAQLNFRQHVFGQKAKKGAYNVTKVVNGKRVTLKLEEMVVNLKSLITASYTQEDTRTDPDETVDHQLVGKTVRHWFEGANEKVSYKGKVLSQVPGYPTWFNLKYEEDEAIYTYQLLQDQKAGDLAILIS